MSEFEKSGLLVKSIVEGADQIVTISARDGETVVPAFNVHLRACVERLGIGRHSIGITVEDPTDLVNRQRRYDAAYQVPFNYHNDVEFVFEGDATSFVTARGISGDKFRSFSSVSVNEDFSHPREDITGRVANPSGNQLEFTVNSVDTKKTVILPRDLSPFVGEFSLDGTILPPKMDLAEVVDFRVSPLVTGTGKK